MEDEPGVGSSSNNRSLTFAEYVDKMCPVYMSMGVPYNEYWHGDYTQFEHYRKAYELQRELQRERANYDAWLQGAYIYDALCAVSPILHAFAKAGTKPAPYHKQPYGEQEYNSPEGNQPAKTAKEIEEIQALNASAKFASFMTQWNKNFKAKEGNNGSNN